MILRYICQLIQWFNLFWSWQDQVSFGSFISAIFSRCTFLFMFFWCYILQNVFRQCIKFASILSLSKENVHLELPVEFLVLCREKALVLFEHTKQFIYIYTFRIGETTFSHLCPGFYVEICNMNLFLDSHIVLLLMKCSLQFLHATQE